MDHPLSSGVNVSILESEPPMDSNRPKEPPSKVKASRFSPIRVESPDLKEKKDKVYFKSLERSSTFKHSTK